MKIQLNGRTFEAPFDARLLLSEMMVATPTPIAEELVSSDPRIVQAGFDKLAGVLAGYRAPRRTTLQTLGVQESVMLDQDPDAMRAMALTIETLLETIQIDTESLGPYCNPGENLEHVRTLAADQVVPAEKEGGLSLYGVSGRNGAGEERVVLCTGNSPRALPIAKAAAIGLYLLPIWIQILRNHADTVKRQQLPAAVIPEYVELFREVRLVPGEGDYVHIEAKPCAKKPFPFMASVDIPYETAGTVYGITCYLMDIPGGQIAIGEMIFLQQHAQQIFMEGATGE